MDIRCKDALTDRCTVITVLGIRKGQKSNASLGTSVPELLLSSLGDKYTCRE